MSNLAKSNSNPSSVVIPSAIASLVEVFSIETEEAAKALIEKATQAIYGHSEETFSFGPRKYTKEELDSTYKFMLAIKPKDFLEALAGAQILVGYLLGMRKLAMENSSDQNLGLKLIRFSNDALERLERKRNGGHQSINVTYNNVGMTNQQAIITPLNKME